MMVIFPDIEAVVVAYLKSVLDSNIFVATKKPVGDDQPEYQVIVTAAYNGEIERMTRLASLTLEVYAFGDVEASNLALLVEAFMRDCSNEYIKKATLRLGAVRMREESQMEKRAIDIELIVKGYDN